MFQIWWRSVQNWAGLTILAVVAGWKDTGRTDGWTDGEYKFTLECPSVRRTDTLRWIYILSNALDRICKHPQIVHVQCTDKASNGATARLRLLCPWPQWPFPWRRHRMVILIFWHGIWYHKTRTTLTEKTNNWWQVSNSLVVCTVSKRITHSARDKTAMGSTWLSQGGMGACPPVVAENYHLSPASGGLALRAPPGICPWTPLDDFRRPQTPLLTSVANSCMATPPHGIRPWLHVK